MKKIFKYLGLFLTVLLMGAFTACIEEQEIETADLGLGIKVFFPTKVVTGQPVTINGSGFKDVTEIVFPGDIVVTNFEHVGASMLRVKTPAGLPAEGGKIKVRNDKNEEAESKVAMTIGKTVITGFSKQEGETVTGGEQITIFGKDLEFVTGVELLDPDGNPYIIEDKDFYRKATSNVIVNIPKRNIFTGSFAGKIYTVDGKEFLMPELAFEPSMEGGHWATVRKTIWKNEGGPAVSWSGTYRFGLDGHDGNNECITTFPQETWDIFKKETFYVLVEATDPQVRITTGWWDPNWKVGDIQPGNELMTDNGDGTWSIKVNLTDDQTFLDALDDRHLLVTGDRFSFLEFYYEVEEWVEGEEEGHWEIVKTPVWTNDGGPAVSWSGTYRFGLDGHDGNNECITTFPEDVWNKLKTQTFYVDVQGEDPQVRITTGWWDPNWNVGDIQPGNELMTDNGDGTWTIKVDLTGDQNFLDNLDDRHLLITGDRFTPISIYFAEEQWVGGGGHMEIVRTSVWKNDNGAAVSWSGTYRFGLDGHDGNNECITTFPEDIWNKLKSETFYIDVQGEDPQVRITTGWWDPNWNVGDIQPGNELMVDNGDGTWTITVNLTGDQNFLDYLDDRHFLITGDRFTPLEIYFAEEQWVGGGGNSGPKEEVFWTNDNGAAVSWSGTYRFGLDGHDGNNECITTFPEDLWNKIKTTTFYLVVQGEDPQVRVTTGWWDPNWNVGDIQPGNELMADNGDGTWTITINLTEDQNFLDYLDDRHLLFTGDRFTPVKLFFLQ